MPSIISDLLFLLYSSLIILGIRETFMINNKITNAKKRRFVNVVNFLMWLCLMAVFFQVKKYF